MTNIPVHPDPETDNRTLPADPKPFPTHISGNEVIAVARFPSRTGEKPNLAFVVLRVDGHPVLRQYDVTMITASDGGVWVVSDGTYDCSYVNAMEIFMERLNGKI